jgi:replication initiation protein RepC
MKAKTMERTTPTSPFGQRPISLGQIAAQLQVRRAVEAAGKPGSNIPAAVNKWSLFRTLTQIRDRLGVSDRALSVLNALLSFHPETALSLPERSEDPDREPDPSCDLIVFPSNKALGLRAHGMTPVTLWRHLTALVSAGLIIRRDSPNGKRYARKAGQGASERFSHAFGFDLTPLIARAAEFDDLAEQARQASRQRQLVKERISLLRRDAGKMIACGLDEGLPGDWDGFRMRFLGLMTPLRRIRSDADLAKLAADLSSLCEEAGTALEQHVFAQKMQGNDLQNAMHQSNSNHPMSSELELSSKEERGDSEGDGEMEPIRDAALEIKQAPGPAAGKGDPGPYPVGLVMEACPDVNDYARSGRVRTWPAFLDAVGMIRPMLGISPDAWMEARSVLGETSAHIVVATILQRSVHSSEATSERLEGSEKPIISVNGSPAIQSPGGYLRALTDQARAGTFMLGPVLMALIGQRLKRRKAGNATDAGLIQGEPGGLG